MLKITKYIGGKSWLVNKLIYPEHKVYVEPFGGMLWIYLNKPSAELNVINDKSKVIYNIYKVVENLPKFEKQFKSAVWFWPISYLRKKIDIEEAIKIEKIPDFETFRIFYLMTLYKYSAILIRNGFSHASVRSYINKIKTYINKNIGEEIYNQLFEVYKKMHNDNLIILNDDFRNVLNKYDSEEAFLFIDPPYHVATDKRYYLLNNMNWDDFWDIIKNIKGKFILTLNMHRDLYKIFREKKLYFKIYERKRFARAEVIISNYENFWKGD